MTRLVMCEVLPDGSVQVRLKKTIVDGNGVEHDVGDETHFHRFTLAPGITVADVKSHVNTTLIDSLGVTAITDADFAFIEEVRANIATPQRIAAYRQAQRDIRDKSINQKGQNNKGNQ